MLSCAIPRPKTELSSFIQKRELQIDLRKNNLDLRSVQIEVPTRCFGPFPTFRHYSSTFRAI